MNRIAAALERALDHHVPRASMPNTRAWIDRLHVLDGLPASSVTPFLRALAIALVEIADRLDEDELVAGDVEDLARRLGALAARGGRS